MSVRLLETDEHNQWDAWLRGTEGANVRQASTYCSALALYGQRSEILAMEESGTFTAGGLLAIRELPSFLGPVVRTSGGLALSDYSDPRRLRDLLGAMLDRCQDLNASSLDVSLRIAQSVGGKLNILAADLERMLSNLGFELCAPMGTYLVDLSSGSSDALLKSFGKNPRRHVRKALREKLLIERSSEPNDFRHFEKAHRAMCKRKGLPSLPREFPHQVLFPIVQAGQGELFVARFERSSRNYIFVGSVGNPTYHWGALTDEAREPNCPQTGQALHYAAMCHFMQLGKTTYDFGGSPDAIPNRTHPNFGVWKFKHEFSGTYVRFLGTWKRKLRPMNAATVSLIRKASKLASLKRKWALSIFS